MTTRERELLLERFRADDLQHWPEDFLAVTLHPGRDLVEQCRRKEIALLMALEGKAAAIDDKFRAFIHARLDVVFDPPLMLCPDDGAIGGIRIVRDADAQSFDRGYQLAP